MQIKRTKHVGQIEDVKHIHTHTRIHTHNTTQTHTLTLTHWHNELIYTKTIQFANPCYDPLPLPIHYKCLSLFLIAWILLL